METAEVYDPTDETWTLISTMKFPASLLAVNTFDGKLYLTYDSFKSGLNGTVFDPHTGESEEWSDITAERYGCKGSTFVSFNGRLYALYARRHITSVSVLDGFSDNVQYFDIRVWTYHARKDKWEEFCRLRIEEDQSSDWKATGLQLLVFEENLSIVYMNVHEPGHDQDRRLCQYVIKDLGSRVISSSDSFHLGPKEGGYGSTQALRPKGAGASLFPGVEYRIMDC